MFSTKISVIAKKRKAKMSVKDMNGHVVVVPHSFCSIPAYEEQN